jgi:cytochrome c553
VNEEQKKGILEKYKQAKQKGVKFYPDIIYKDILISFALFIVLVIMAIFIGVVNEPKANPSDTAYVPRPEWYFLFLFEMLKYFPGEIEWIGTAIIPGLAVLALFLLPFFDRNPNRHWSKRKFAITFMTVIVLGMVGLTILAAATTPEQEEEGVIANTMSEQIVVGEELYSIHCVECHGPEGEGGEIKGVEGLEGVILDPINTEDVMYPFTDETLYNIIDMGQPNLGMPPFSTQFGGELSPAEIEYLVTFMRYTWDDRAELPEEPVAAAAIPTLAPNEVPSYEVHVAPIIKRYCISCHRPGKKNNNYTMGSYEEVMTSGDNAPNVIPGDMTSILLRTLHREEMENIGPMPPSKALKPELIAIFERWVAGGALNTAAEAAAATAAGAGGTTVPITATLTITGTIVPGSTITPTIPLATSEATQQPTP